MIMSWIIVFALFFVAAFAFAILRAFHLSVYAFCAPFVLLLTFGLKWLFLHISLISNWPSALLSLLAFAAGVLLFIVVAWIVMLGGGLVKGASHRLSTR